MKMYTFSILIGTTNPYQISHFLDQDALKTEDFSANGDRLTVLTKAQLESSITTVSYNMKKLSISTPSATDQCLPEVNV